MTEPVDAGDGAAAELSPSGAPDNGESPGGVTVLEPDTPGDVVEGSATAPDVAVETAQRQVPSLIAEELELELPPGSHTVVVSDLHLPAVATPTSTAVATELAAVLGDATGPAAFVVAGDGFEMLAGPPDVGKILDAHPQFAGAAARFAAEPDHHVVVLSGNHDGQLAWDGASIDVLRQRLGVEGFALSCNLTIGTEHGPERVRVVHGNQADPYNTFEDPWSPVDTPFGHHVVRQLLPELESRQSPGSLLEGVQWLDGDIADFIGSRLFYRKLVGKLWLVAVPFVAILLLRLLSFLPGVHGLLRHHAQLWLLGFGLLVALIIVVAACGGGGHPAAGQPGPPGDGGQRPLRSGRPQRPGPRRGRPTGDPGLRRDGVRPHPRAGAVRGGSRLLRQHRQRDGIGGPSTVEGAVSRIPS